MRDASTPEITEFILWNGANARERARPVALIRYDDDGTFVKLSDVRSLTGSISSINKQHGKFLLVPPANSLSASIDNRRSKYSPGSGGEFDGVLVRNRLIKAFVGYEVGEGATETNGFSVSNNLILYHTKIVGSQIENDVASAVSFTNLPGISDSWTFYDTETYDDSTYAPEGYYLGNIVEYEVDEKVLSITIESDTTGIEVFFRASDVESDLTGNIESFTSLGSTIVGAKVFPIDVANDKYFQFALVFQTGLWGTGYAKNISIQTSSLVELFPLGEFLIDTPSFNASSGNFTAGISARDKLKKAYETKINTPAYTNADVAQIMRDACDRSNMPHNDSGELIVNTGFTVTIIADNTWKNAKAIDVLNECMIYLNFKDNDYRLELNEDGFIQLTKKTVSFSNVSWVIDYRDNMVSISKKFESDKLLNRATFLAKEHTVDEEVQLATDTKTSAGTFELTWSGEAIYKDVSVVETGDGVFTLNFVENEKINYTIAGSSPNTVITVKGNKLQASPPFAGESIFFNNHEDKDGFTKKILNRLIQSDTEAKDMAEGLILIWGNPEFKTIVKLPCNPLLVLGDFVLLNERFTNTDTIYRIDKISVNYNAQGASLYQTLSLSDTGVLYTNIVWDRHNSINGGTSPGVDDRLWDTGTIWDQDLDVSVTEDTTDYTSLKKVRVG